MLRLALTPRWLGFLVLVLLVDTIFVTLSAWQVDRAEHKNDVVSAQDVDTVKDFDDVMAAEVPMPGYLSDQRVEVTGHYLPDDQIVVVDRLDEGREGSWVVTMFVPDDATLGAEATLDPETAAGDTDREIAIPVVRGWAPDAETAHASRAADGEVTMTARVGPVEGPETYQDLEPGEAKSVSTSQLVNEFDVYSYSGILFPESETGPGASTPAPSDEASPEAAAGLEHVALAKQESGGVDFQSAAYAVEWLIFAVFALYIWYRLLRDEHERNLLADGKTPVAAPGDYVVVKRAGESRIDPEALTRPESAAPPENTAHPRPEDDIRDS